MTPPRLKKPEPYRPLDFELIDSPLNRIKSSKSRKIPSSKHEHRTQCVFFTDGIRRKSPRECLPSIYSNSKKMDNDRSCTPANTLREETARRQTIWLILPSLDTAENISHRETSQNRLFALQKPPETRSEGELGNRKQPRTVGKPPPEAERHKKRVAVENATRLDSPSFRSFVFLCEDAFCLIVSRMRM